MKHSKRFDRAISALVNAFFGGTLAKGTCQMCAVGNIVASVHGLKNCSVGDVSEKPILECEITDGVRVPIGHWKLLFVTMDNGKQYKRLSPDVIFAHGWSIDSVYIERVIEMILKTGYTEDELARVEHAFESSTYIDFNDYDVHSPEVIMKDQFDGLMAVVDVLCDIEGIDSTETKSLFDYAYDVELIK